MRNIFEDLRTRSAVGDAGASLGSSAPNQRNDSARGAATLGRSVSSIAKRLLDIVLSACALVLLAPLLLLTAAAIRIQSPGPALFRQTRLGLGERPFKMYKFRTMHVMEDGPVIVQAAVGDPRITQLGRVLRKTSFDELPQLINVLLGDMSLVGPRPHAVAHDVYYSGEIAEYARRLTVLPGITGWAQINGARGETPTLDHMRERVSLDLWYIERWSMGLDVVILFRTVTGILHGHSLGC